jgi:hypothetical protein
MDGRPGTARGRRDRNVVAIRSFDGSLMNLMRLEYQPQGEDER